MSAGVEDEPSDQDVLDDALAGRATADRIRDELQPVGRDRVGRDRVGRDEGGPDEGERGSAATPPVITGSGRTTADGAVGRPEPPITVEQAYRAKLKAARDARPAEPRPPTPTGLPAGPTLRPPSDPVPERTVDADTRTGDDQPDGPAVGVAAGSLPAPGAGSDSASGAGPDRATPSVRPVEVLMPGSAGVAPGPGSSPTGVAPRPGSVATPGPADRDRPLAVRRPVPPPGPPAPLRARPRVEPEVGILGLSRHSRSRLGSRLFTLFFVLVFGLILVQLVVTLLQP